MSASEQHVLNFWRNVEVFDLPQFNKDSYPLIEIALCLGYKENDPQRKITFGNTLYFLEN